MMNNTIKDIINDSGKHLNYGFLFLKLCPPTCVFLCFQKEAYYIEHVYVSPLIIRSMY